ncbi:MAG TPA: FAD-binding protein, partial [Sphingomonadaceae bacterium]|nr:FAD-binding protein [Sphingomonadaceae bacterium]
MIRDLSGQGVLAEEVDVLVIGAGTAGMVAASLLSRQGLVVHCLESGSAEQREDTHPLNECEQVGTYYAGADHGRFRCLGGTSTRWGGAMIPFQAQDMAPDLWPIGAEELSPYADRVEELFHLPPGDYADPALMDGPEFIARLAKWPPFRRRNTYNLFRQDADSPTGPTIWLNATVTRLALSQGRVSEVAAQAPDGSSIRIRAKEVILAAGSIESTRLLLLADRANGGAISASSTGLGCYFHDHLSAVVGEIEAFDRIKLNQRVGFSFAEGGAMRNVRFELEPASSLRQSVPPCFAHIGFDDETGGGFDALRDVFRQLQRRRLPGIKTMLRLVAGAPWLTRAVWWRLARKRLLYPAETSLKLHMVIEQAAVPGNRISLSDDRVDVYGQPLARIEWNVSA